MYIHKTLMKTIRISDHRVSSECLPMAGCQPKSYFYLKDSTEVPHRDIPLEIL